MSNPDAKRVTFAQLMARAKEEMPAQIEFEQFQAKLKRVRFLALIAEGFTETQAMDLCKEWKS